MIKKAIVHEWLVNYAGSERVVESFINIWPEADVYTLVDFLDDDLRRIILKGKSSTTSFIQYLPFSRKKHRNYLPLFPTAVERFNISGYDLILSSAHAVAKGVKKNKSQLHICYCHSPMRYAWDQSDYYLKEANLQKGVKGKLASSVINYLRKWDLKSAENVDYFIANSNYISEKIKRIYNRDSITIYPPVDTHFFNLEPVKEDYYLAASRLVPYKRIDLVVEAFSRMPEKKLLVAGSGPEFEKIKSKITSNIKLLGYLPHNELRTYMQKAKAFVFPAEEDFGIIVVEAMACGTPVICFNKGGAKETVIPDKTGIFFDEQNAASIISAVNEFESESLSFDGAFIRNHSLNFSREKFEEKILKFVNNKCKELFK
jgi:glycosyltransferase involved in cell wall biosynthesis